MKGDVKKSKVYVDPDGDGKAQKVNFGDKKLSIKKDQPDRKKSYCARSSGQGNLTDKTSANYWSRKAWNCEEETIKETKMDKNPINEALLNILSNDLSEMKENLTQALQEKAIEKLEERKKEIAANYFAQ